MNRAKSENESTKSDYDLLEQRVKMNIAKSENVMNDNWWVNIEMNKQKPLGHAPAGKSHTPKITGTFFLNFVNSTIA